MRSLLTATLTSHVIADPPPVGAKLWRSLRAIVGQSEDIDAISAWVRMNITGDGAVTIARRLDVIDQMANCLRGCENEGVFLVTEFDSEYPRRWHARLGEKRPALLFAVGNRALLQAESIGVVGSRDVDEAGTTFARAVAAEAVSHDKALVSGGARGVDLIAMRAALDKGGTTVGFLADSLLTLARRPAMREFIEDGRVCLATIVSPSAGFSVGNAMGRNRLIYAHSLATVVVASAVGTGGTWTGATEAIKNRLCPVLVRTGPGVPEGNVRLAAAGGIAIASPQDIWAHLGGEHRELEQGLLF